jgi:hypothetical protein
MFPTCFVCLLRVSLDRAHHLPQKYVLMYCVPQGSYTQCFVQTACTFPEMFKYAD